VTLDAPARAYQFARARSLALVTAVLVVLWFAAILLTPWIRFVIYTPRAKTGFDVSLSILSLFADNHDSCPRSLSVIARWTI